MEFELNFIIPEQSPEGQVLAALVSRDKVLPEEAIRQAIRRAGNQRDPLQRMIGVFSSDEDAATMDVVLELATESSVSRPLRCDARVSH
jgi:hypothetical protein